MRYIFSFFALLSAFLSSPVFSQTKCSVYTNNGLNYYQAVIKPDTTVIRFDPNSIPVGGQIASIEKTVSYANSKYGESSSAEFICNTHITESYVKIIQPLSHFSGGLPHYKTTVPGITMTILMKSYTSNKFTQPGLYKLMGIGNEGHLPPNKFRITFIKSKETISEGIISGIFAQEYLGGYSTQQYSSVIQFDSRAPIRLQPTISTCKHENQLVKIPTLSSSIFDAPGKTSPSHSFDLSLQCAAVNSGASIDVHVKLIDALNQGNTTTILKTDSRVSSDNPFPAKGVGIQVLKDGTPLALGSSWKATTLAQSQAQGTVQVPLEVRYIQTDATVTPGSVQARATVTLSYQ